MNRISDIISSYLPFSKGRTIAIYGMGKVGKTLFDEIKSEGPICIDNNISSYEKPIILENNVKKYYVIISPLNDYTDIVDEIQRRGYIEIRDFLCLGKLQPIHVLMGKKSRKNVLSGNYKNLNEVQKELDRLGVNKGYAEENILNSVLEATQIVRKGKAEYERDSIVFYKKTWNFQFLSSMFYIFRNIGKQKINVLDFGGALGSTFFQHRTELKNVDWNIVEQEGYVKIGRDQIPEINFFHNIQEYIDAGKNCDVLNMSSVLMYLSDPYSSIEELLKNCFSYVWVDRTYFNVEDYDRLCIQTVPDEIYHASYPAWLLSEKKIDECFESKGYRKVMSWFSTLENEEKEYLVLEDNGEMLIPSKGMLYSLINGND